MISFELSEEQRQVRDMLSAFATNELAPRAREADETRCADPCPRCGVVAWAYWARDSRVLWRGWNAPVGIDKCTDAGGNGLWLRGARRGRLCVFAVRQSAGAGVVPLSVVG